jgi:hypothetical protein
MATAFDDTNQSAAPSAWAAALEQLAVAGDRMTEQLRERGEPEATADAYTALLGAAMESYLTDICGEPDFPNFVPCCGYFQHTGSPNPDTVYRRAVIDGSGTYRITGERGTAWQVTIMAFGRPTATGMRTWAPFDLSDVTGPDGRFDVLLSAERPSDHDGDWWPLDPEMATLWLRTVSDDWGNETEPRIAIGRVDAPRSRPRPSGESLRKKITGFSAIVERSIDYGIRHTDELVDGGYVNTLKILDSVTGGMPLQWYCEAVFDLDDGNGLLVEATLPDGCDYFSCSLTDRMFVTLDWTHAQTSLNRTQVALDDDGRLRFVVAGRDVGIRNWLDTTGYRRGVLQCRFIGSETPPELEATLVPLASLPALLPATTAWVDDDERARDLDVRRRGAQLRTLW